MASILYETIEKRNTRKVKPFVADSQQPNLPIWTKDDRNDRLGGGCPNL
jgi:hypothetical protein